MYNLPTQGRRLGVLGGKISCPPQGFLGGGKKILGGAFAPPLQHPNDYPALLTWSQDAIPVSGLREFVLEFFAGGLQLFVVAGHQSHVEDLTFT